MREGRFRSKVPRNSSKAPGLRPIHMRRAGEEWIVELDWKTEADGGHSTCGMFVSRNQDEALAYLKNAERIFDCWYVDLVWKQEGLKT